MIILAGAFATFVLFLFLGLLALPITAALDKGIGKEKGLLLFSLALLAFTFFMLMPEGPDSSRAQAGRENDVPVEALVLNPQSDPFARATPSHETSRNVFEPYSDTSDLPPVSLEAPPWIALDFALPPTIPGPAPGFRKVLRGGKPTVADGDSSAIAEIPDAVFRDYERTPSDVYDWVLNAGRPYYVYVAAIRDDAGKWHREGTTGYERLKWILKTAGDGFEGLTVRYATIGFEEAAAKKLADLDVLTASKKNRSDKLASQQSDGWFLRRTVANLYYEALVSQGLRPTADLATLRNPDALRRAARAMAEVGRTGKESKAGWRRCAELVEAALIEIRANRGPAERADALLELLEAYKALRDEQAVLRTLAEYMRASPNSAEARTWLGRLHLEGMHLPTEALRYFRAALSKDSRYGPALIGAGDALTFLGEHEAALLSYTRDGSDAGLLRRASAQLRVGKLAEARGTAESLLSRDPSNMTATLVRACALYGLGDLDTARGAFEQVAAAESAQAIRAQACYDLGLTCLRLGQSKAALEAFDACDKALSLGSGVGPTPDEAVSPSLGRALVAFAAGDESTMRTHLDKARREASRSSYVEMFAGMISSIEGNDASAVRALDSALRNAPRYGELDGWLGKTYARLGARAVATGASPRDSAETFDRAIAFAGRDADRAQRADPNAYAARLREALVRIGAEHLPTRKRYTLALAAVDKVLGRSQLREQPAALALGGYCYFQLGEYEECIRKFQAVLDVVPGDQEGHPWAAWRAYADTQLKTVKHWRSLEEKVVTFKSWRLDKTWENAQAGGVRVHIEDREMIFEGRANTDGNFNKPIVIVQNGNLFARESFESLSVDIEIPREKGGVTTNNITFGVQIVAAGRRGRSKSPGIGVFYDRARIAVRVQGGQEKKYKEGNVMRLDPAMDWPAGDKVTLRIVREDPERGTVAVYLNDTFVVRDNVSTFKLGRGKAALWIGGYSTETQDFDVKVSDIRIVRRKKR